MDWHCGNVSRANTKSLVWSSNSSKMLIFKRGLNFKLFTDVEETHTRYPPCIQLHGHILWDDMSMHWSERVLSHVNINVRHKLFSKYSTQTNTQPENLNNNNNNNTFHRITYSQKTSEILAQIISVNNTCEQEDNNHHDTHLFYIYVLWNIQRLFCTLVYL